MLDASRVDVASLAFGPADAAATHGAGHLEDLDAEGDLDPLVHYATQVSGLTNGATQACVTGATLDRQPLQRCDAIRTTRA